MRAKLITSSTQISDSKISIFGYQIFPDGSNAATLTLYNESDDSKTDSKRVSAARTPATESKEVRFNKSLYCDSGLYADLSGANAIAFIFIE